MRNNNGACLALHRCEKTGGRWQGRRWRRGGGVMAAAEEQEAGRLGGGPRGAALRCGVVELGGRRRCSARRFGRWVDGRLGSARLAWTRNCEHSRTPTHTAEGRRKTNANLTADRVAAQIRTHDGRTGDNQRTQRAVRFSHPRVTRELPAPRTRPKL